MKTPRRSAGARRTAVTRESLDLQRSGRHPRRRRRVGHLKNWLDVRRRTLSRATSDCRRHAGVAGRRARLREVPDRQGDRGQLDLPLAALDTGRLHGSLVGSRAPDPRRARLGRGDAPAVLDGSTRSKAFGGGGAEQDGGVSNASWACCSVVAGAAGRGVRGGHEQRRRALPPELLRRGRFDDVFFVDLRTTPNAARSSSRFCGRVVAMRLQFELPAVVIIITYRLSPGRARRCGDVRALCRLRRWQTARHCDRCCPGWQDRAAVTPAGRGHRGVAGLGARPRPPCLTGSNCSG